MSYYDKYKNRKYLRQLFCILDDRYEIKETGEICVDKKYEIKSEGECKDAAVRLDLEWGYSFSEDGDFPACLYAQDRRNQVFFNLSPNPSRENVNPKYSAICNVDEGTDVI